MENVLEVVDRMPQPCFIQVEVNMFRFEGGLHCNHMCEDFYTCKVPLK